MGRQGAGALNDDLQLSYAAAGGGDVAGGNPNGDWWEEWGWLVEALAGPIREKIWEQVVAFVGHELDILINPLREIRERIQWAVAAVYAIPASLYQRLAELRDTLAASLNYWLWRVVSSADSLRGYLGGALAGAAYAVVGGLQAGLGWLLGGLSGAAAQLGGLISGPLNGLISLLVNLPGALIGGIAGHLEALAQALLSAPHTIAAGVLLAIARVEAFLQSIPDRLQTIWHELQLQFWRNVADLWSDLTGGATAVTAGVLNVGTRVLAGAMAVLAQGPPPELAAVTERLTGTLTAGLSGIQDILLGGGQVTPERAPELAVRAFLTASGIGFSAHLLSTAIELAHPLRYVGLHYLSGFLGSMGSFNSVAYAAMGVMVREAVANPMAYHIRARTRPTLPTGGDLQALRRKHNITASEFAANMAYQGYSDFWIQRMEEYLPADPRLLEITRIADTCLPSGAPPADALPLLERLGIRTREAPGWWLQMKLALAGYNWIDIPQLQEVIQKRLVQSEYNRLIATASVAFRRGYMDESQYRTELAVANQNPAQIDIRVHAEQISALVDDIADLEAMYIDAFKKDLVSRAECLVALVNVGLTRRKAEVLVSRAEVSRTPRPTKPTTTAEEKAVKELQTKYSELYRRQFVGDLVTADQYYENLVAIGLEPRLAVVTVQIEVTKKAVQTRTVAVKTEEKAATATRKVYEKLYKEQFLAGVLDADGYYENLVAIGLEPDQARGTVALELVKMYQLGRRAELKAEEKLAVQLQKEQAALYVRRYRAGDIDAAALLERLLELDLNETLAKTTVQLETLKRRQEAEKVLAQVVVPALRVPFDLAVAQLKAALQAGEISPADFIQELLETGLAEDTAALILEFA